MRRIFTISLAALLCSTMMSKAQMPGPFYRQFYYNPYLFNPAYVAINNEVEANLSYRQQWTNFKDAPVTAGASLQFPASERVALGFNLYSDKQVLLRNSNFMATFGYVVPISKNQSLRFALSGGVGLNKLDLTAEELNTNDPAIANAAGNNFYVDGNFGIVYSIAGLRVGFALTDLFKSNAFNEENFNKFEMSNLRNRLFSASYRFNVGVMENFAIEPYVLYRQTEDGLQDAWEAASLIYYKNKIWTGASYNQNNGVALFFGANLKEKIRFGYSYEFPPFSTGFPTTSSHELHLSIRLGKKKQTIAKTTTIKPAPQLANAPIHNDPSGGNKNPSRTVNADAPDDYGVASWDRVAAEESTNNTGKKKAAVVAASGSKNGGNKKPAPVVTEEKNSGNKKPAAVVAASAPDNGGNKKPAAVKTEEKTTTNEKKKPAAVVAAEGANKKKVETPVVVSEQERVKEQRTKEPPVTVAAPPANREEVKKTAPRSSKLNESFTMSKGHYYVVVKEFSVMSHSMKFTKEMFSKGQMVNVGLNPKNNIYYVYIYSTLDPEDAKRVRNEYRRKNLFKEVWVFNIE